MLNKFIIFLVIVIIITVGIGIFYRTNNEDDNIDIDEEITGGYIEAAVNFNEEELYGVVYLGIDMSKFEYYADKYLGYTELENYIISEGEYYLIIPKENEVELKIIHKTLTDDGVTEKVAVLVGGSPFIIRCNISDIFPDALISIQKENNYTEFTPYISLVDGSIMVGEKGKNLTDEE